MRKILLLLFLPLLLLPARGAEKPEEASRPNFVVILADDQGYADVGFHGSKEVSTPSIDRIAAEGVRFSQGYVSAAVCSPTRAGLLTGRYQQRFGHEFNTGGIRKDVSGIGLPTSEKTVADLLAEAGYATGVVGKWHLGSAAKFHPLERGFGEFFGFLGGAHPYFPRRGARDPILRGREPVDEKAYLTDAFGREAAAFVDRHADRPFFLYLAFNAVHTPMQAKPEDTARFESVENGKRRTYAAMLSSMDAAVGRVLAALDRHGVAGRTLVVFLSDNGGPPRANGSNNDPLRGGKGTMYEGGIRVPFAARWPDRLPEGAVYAEPVISLDLMPTVLAAAGATVPEGVKLDGVDLLPFLAPGAEDRPHRDLFWRSGTRYAVRHGDLKLVGEGGDPELYDLAADVSESKDLAAGNPGKVNELRDLFRRWEKGTVPPKWGKPVRRKRERR